MAIRHQVNQDGTEMSTQELGRAFIERSRYYLSAEYFPKIERSMRQLSEEEVWRRDNPYSNSVGNLLLHLAGNVRQWIVSGVGGAPDVRQRHREFEEEGPVPSAELLARLRATLDEADGVLAALSPEALGERRAIQGNDVTVFEAVYHVVEHFSMHTGQIIYVTKLRMAVDMGFYEVSEGGAVRPRWLNALES